MFSLPALPYDYTALEPHIDAKTMEIHHSNHHQAYIDKLNAALESEPDLQTKTVEELVSSIVSLPMSVQKAVQNHGGGHANHSLFWTILTPDSSGQPEAELAEALVAKFGSFENFTQEFSAAAGSVFGSGWAWLVVNPDQSLEITTSPNQDSPLMSGKTPVLGLDVWEHAYYLQHQNRRPDYIAAFWKIINWAEVNRRFQAAIG